MLLYFFYKLDQSWISLTYDKSNMMGKKNRENVELEVATKCQPEL